MPRLPSCRSLAGFPCPAYSKLGRRFERFQETRHYDGGWASVHCLPQAACGSAGASHWFPGEEALAGSQDASQNFGSVWLHCSCQGVENFATGLPKSRPRLWMVALRDPVQEFRFPKVLQRCPPLESVLDLDKVGDECMDLSKFGTRQETSKLWTEYWILDVGLSARFTSIPKKRISPCLTRSRCKGNGYYVPRLARRLSVQEMARLQGVPVCLCHSMVQKLLQQNAGNKRFTLARCEAEVAAAFGDGMSVNVLQRVLAKASVASGLWPSQIEKTDFWASPAAVQDVEEAFRSAMAR